MDKYVFAFVISFFLYAKIECRSWYKNDREIAFEDYKDPWWHYTDKDSEEWGHHSGDHESNYKHLRNWNPDNVWFPDFDKYYSSSSTTSSTKQLTPTLPPINVKECIRQCPTTSEYNPVCGTNRITYPNIGRLICAQMCGVDVRLHRKVPCSLDVDPSTTENIPTEPDLQRQCIEACPTTSEYNPICGTNNVTYQNRGKLECAKACGVVIIDDTVTRRHDHSTIQLSFDDSDDTCYTSLSVANLTYNRMSLDKQAIISTCPDVELKRLSPCPEPITTMSPVSEDLVSSRDELTWTTSPNNDVLTRSTETTDKPKFTISQDILNNIFNIPATDSNEADIDIRLGE